MGTLFIQVLRVLCPNLTDASKEKNERKRMIGGQSVNRGSPGIYNSSWNRMPGNGISHDNSLPVTHSISSRHLPSQRSAVHGNPLHPSSTAGSEEIISQVFPAVTNDFLFHSLSWGRQSNPVFAWRLHPKSREGKGNVGSSLTGG